MRSMSCVGLIVAGIFAGACGGDPPPAPVAPPAPTVASAPTPPPPDPTPEPAPPAPKPSMAEMQKATLTTMAANFSDAAKYSDGFSDDATVVFAGMPDAKGKDAIVKSHQNFLDGFPDVKSSATRVWVKNDVVISEWVVSGTNSKDWMGGKATNKSIAVNGASIAWFNADGKIKEQHLFLDIGTVMGQLGVSKQKVRALAAIPSGMPEVHVAKGTPDEDKNLDPVKAYMAAMDSKKEVDFLATMDDGMEFDAFDAPATMKGKAEAKKFFGMWTKAFPDAKSSMTNTWTVEDVAIVETAMTGTQKGALGPIKATNKPVNLHSLNFLKVSNGKAMRGWSYANGGELMGELGLLPAPGSAKGDAPKPPTDAKKSAAPTKK